MTKKQRNTLTSSNYYQISENYGKLTWWCKPPPEYAKYFIRRALAKVVLLHVVLTLITWILTKNVVHFFISLVFINIPIGFLTFGLARYLGKILLRRDYLKKVKFPQDIQYPRPPFNPLFLLPIPLILIGIYIIRYSIFGQFSLTYIILFPIIVIPMAFGMRLLTPIHIHLMWEQKGEINLESGTISLEGHMWFPYKEIFDFQDVHLGFLYDWLTVFQRPVTGIYVVTNNFRYFAAMFVGDKDNDKSYFDNLSHYIDQFIKSTDIELTSRTYKSIKDFPPSGRITY